MIGRSFSELTDALIFAGSFQEAIETARRGLAYLEGDVSVNRGVFSMGLAGPWPKAMSRAHEALKEGLKMASQLPDPKLVA